MDFLRETEAESMNAAEPEPDSATDLEKDRVSIEASCSDQKTRVLDDGWRDYPSCRGLGGLLGS